MITLSKSLHPESLAPVPIKNNGLSDFFKRATVFFTESIFGTPHNNSEGRQRTGTVLLFH
mgnify:CR=1 FL=1